MCPIAGTYADIHSIFKFSDIRAIEEASITTTALYLARVDIENHPPVDVRGRIASEVKAPDPSSYIRCIDSVHVSVSIRVY